MEAIRIAETEEEYRRIWGSYWIFWRKVRYGKPFLVIVLSSSIIAAVLLTLAQPESGLYPVIAIIAILISVAAIVLIFDYFQYLSYLKRIAKFYREEESGKEYQVKFDEQYFYLNEQKTEWKFYRYYCLHKQDIYLFKTKSEISGVWSENSLGAEAFKILVALARSNLKILPSAKRIL
jgi:hypothetical protein